MVNITNVGKILDFFSISRQDRETLNAFFNNSDKNELPTLFFSLTHLKHNYITLTHLFNLAKLSKLGFNIVIILWDMNILSNPYFKKIEFEKYGQWTSEQYINKKKDEIVSLAFSLGMPCFKVYTSSDLWTRFLQQKEKSLFPKYYSVLSTMDLDEHNVDEKLNYLIQLPADVFFANFFQELFPEDFKKPVDVMYSTPQRKTLYSATRKAMHNEGLTSTERPLLIISKEIPRIEIDSQIPHWDMTPSEINQLISRWRFEKDDIKNLYRNVIGTILPKVALITKAGAKDVDLEGAIELLQNESRENIVASTSKNLFTYFQHAKELTKNVEEPRPDFYTVTTKKELKQLSALLKSENIMGILVLANGTRTVSEISKEMNMQLSNTSQYITKLKKAGIIKIKNKKVTRIAKGLKINFDVSLGS